MSKKSNVGKFILVVFCAGILVYGLSLVTAWAKEIPVKSDRRLQDLIIKNQYAVLMIYQEDQETKKDKNMREQLRQLREMFKAVSSDTFYKEADLAFLTANVASKELDYLPRRYQIKTLPAFVIFKNSKSAEVAAGQPLVLSGFVDRGQLQDFIDENLKAELEDVLKEKAEARKAELEEARIRSYYAPSVYFVFGFRSDRKSVV